VNSTTGERINFECDLDELPGIGEKKMVKRNTLFWRAIYLALLAQPMNEDGKRQTLTSKEIAQVVAGFEWMQESLGSRDVKQVKRAVEMRLGSLIQARMISRGGSEGYRAIEPELILEESILWAMRTDPSEVWTTGEWYGEVTSVLWSLGLWGDVENEILSEHFGYDSFCKVMKRLADEGLICRKVEQIVEERIWWRLRQESEESSAESEAASSVGSGSKKKNKKKAKKGKKKHG